MHISQEYSKHETDSRAMITLESNEKLHDHYYHVSGANHHNKPIQQNSFGKDINGALVIHNDHLDSSVAPFAVYHICRACKRPRSRRFHRNHPIPINAPAEPPGVCRRCHHESQPRSKEIEIVRQEESNSIRLGVRSLVPEVAYVSREERTRMQDKVIIKAMERQNNRRNSATADSNITREESTSVIQERRAVERSVKQDDHSSSLRGAEDTYIEALSVADAHKHEQTIDLQKSTPPLTDKPASDIEDRAVAAKEDQQISTEAKSEPVHGDEHIRRICHDVVERYLRAERRIAAHPEPFAYGRLVPIKKSIGQDKNERHTTEKAYVVDRQRDDKWKERDVGDRLNASKHEAGYRSGAEVNQIDNETSRSISYNVHSITVTKDDVHPLGSEKSLKSETNESQQPTSNASISRHTPILDEVHHEDNGMHTPSRTSYTKRGHHKPFYRHKNTQHEGSTTEIESRQKQQRLQQATVSGKMSTIHESEDERSFNRSGVTDQSKTTWREEKAEVDLQQGPRSLSSWQSRPLSETLHPPDQPQNPAMLSPHTVLQSGAVPSSTSRVGSTHSSRVRFMQSVEASSPPSEEAKQQKSEQRSATPVRQSQNQDQTSNDKKRKDLPCWEVHEISRDLPDHRYSYYRKSITRGKPCKGLSGTHHAPNVHAGERNGKSTDAEEQQGDSPSSDNWSERSRESEEQVR